MKTYPHPSHRALLLAVLSLAILAACNLIDDPTAPPFPTASVPSLFEIDGAITRWAESGNTRYFVIVEETTSAGTFEYRVATVDGEIQAAQVVEKIAGDWQEPVSLDFETAQNYTVEALLQRIRRDANGEGAAPMDVFTVFDPGSGYPQIVETKALPTYNDAGQIELNRAASYSFTVFIDVLLADTIGLNKEVLLGVYSTGGPEAWCSTLRIFTDGTAAYTDDCRQNLLQISPPVKDVARLQELAASVAAFEESETKGDGTRRIVFNGTGTETADPAIVAEIRELSDLLADLLSRPIGTGVTLLRTQGNYLLGFDLLSSLEQPTSLATQPPLYGARTLPAENRLVYADAEGLHWLDTRSGETGLYFANPSGQTFDPQVFLSDGRLILTRSTEGADSLEWGWVSLEDRAWHDLPSVGNCVSGLAAHPTAALLAVTATHGGEGCQSEASLWVIDVDSGEAAPVVDRAVTGVGDAAPTGGYSPHWAPDGQWIALTLDEGPPAPEPARVRLYIVRPDGSSLTPLTFNTEGRAAGPLWSPDGLLYYSLTGAETAADGIYIYDPATEAHTLGLAGSNLTPISLSPSGQYMAFAEGGELRVWLIAFGQVVAVTINSDGNSKVVGWLEAFVIEQ